MKKIVFFLILCLAFIFTFSASGISQNSGDTITVGWVTFTLEAAYFQNSVAGAKEEAEIQGVEIIVLDPRANVETQVSQIEDLISRDVDAIVIDAIESGAVIGAVEEASKRGIKVIAVDTYIDHPKLVSTIATPNFDSSREFGRFISGWISSKYDGKAKIGIMLASTEVQLERRDGFMEALKSIPDSEVVATGDGRNIYERALAEAEDMFTANPDINVIYATGDPQLMGALAAAEAQGLTNIDFFGWDDIPDHFIPPVQDGRLIGFTNQLPAEKARLALRYAVKAVKGEEVPKFVASPLEIVTRHNVKKCYIKEQARVKLEKIKKYLLEKQPVLQDEIYTAILWLRLDSQKKYEEGKYLESIVLLEIVERLINLK
jgi:ribose transport system substrate-binding protein